MASKIDIVIEAVDNLSSTVKQIEGNIDRMSKKTKTSMKRIENSSREMSAKTTTSLKKVNSAFGQISVNIRRMGALVGSFYAVRSAATAFAGIADDFKDFNAAMAYVNTIALKTEDQLASLTLQVEALSLKVGIAAPEIARGLYDIYSSGFEGAEAMKVLEVATTGAIAGLTKTDVAARGLMAIMNAYNRKTGPDAVDIMDSMFKTVDKGVITFEELASEIGSVVTVSSQLGIPFIEISAAMSEMTLRGISAAEAATALEGLMRSIMKPADQTKEAIKKLNEQNKDLNFKWDVATLRAKGLHGMMKELNIAAQGNFEVVGKIVPSIRGLRSAMVLATNDGEGFSEMLEEQENRVGATDRALEEANKSVRRQLEMTKVEWEKYKRKVGEVLAEVELKMMKSLVTFAKWIDKNIDTIIALIDTLTKLTTAFIVYKTAVLAVAGITAIFKWFVAVQAAVVALNVTMGAGITTAMAYKAAIASIGMGAVVGAGALGLGAILYQSKKLEQAQDAALSSEVKRYDMIIRKAREYKETSEADIKILHDIRESARDREDQETVKKTKVLEKNILDLKSLYIKKLAELSKTEGERLFSGMNEKIKEQQEIVRGGIKNLEESGKLIGGLTFLPSPTGAEITIPEYPEFPTIEELLGPEIDKDLEKAVKKIANTIKKVTKDISEYYADLGNFANEHTEVMEEQADAFADLALDFSRYLEDMNIDLERMETQHKQAIQSIKDDIADENRDFAESMDDRARKFQDTMASMTTRHTDKTDDIKHQIALEEGMGVRADKEKLRELYLRLERENRDFADKVAKDTEEKEREDERDRRRNDESLADFEARLEKEKSAYAQKADDIKRMLDREKFDYFSQQEDIRAKTQDTLRGIVEDYQKAFKNIFETIRESGVPSLLAKLPELMEISTTQAIEGIQIPRNLAAEQEFVQNWGGLYGRLPSAEEISMGVYGTPTGPNIVNVTINNPVVLDETYTNQLIQQVQVGLGNSMRLAQNGAY